MNFGVMTTELSTLFLQSQLVKLLTNNLNMRHWWRIKYVMEKDKETL